METTNLQQDTVKNDPNFLMVLNRVFRERKVRNPCYSLRAFSRDLGISPSQLCLVLKGNKKLPTKQACRIGMILQLDEKAFYTFITSTLDN